MKRVLILFLLVSNYLFSQYVFTSKQQLQTAIESWISNENISTSVYGHISTWDVSNLTDMNDLFKPSEVGSNGFNSDISSWDVSNVTMMQRMFKGQTLFNQNINSWDVSNVTTFVECFEGASSFNQPLNNWNMSNVTSVSGMFKDAISFNQDISNWDTSNFFGCQYMFRNAKSFNQDISNWDTSSLLFMKEMFMDAESFNQDISNWDVSNVDSMYKLFYNAINFNQPLTSWDTSNVESVSYMFKNASSFDQDLSVLEFKKIRQGGFIDFVSYSGLSVQNYDILLQTLVTQYLENSGISGLDNSNTTQYFGAHGLKYCQEDYRQYLKTTIWVTLYDDGKDCSSLTIENISNNQFKIYPNPTNNILNIDFNDYKSSELFSIVGKSVLKSTSKQIDLSKEVKGIYFLVIEDTTGKKSNGIKVIKE